MFRKSQLLIFILFVSTILFAAEPVWLNKLASEMTGAPAFTEKTIIVATKNGSLFSFTYEGKLKWKKKLGSPLFAPPSIGDDGLIYQALFDGRINVIASDGKVVREQVLKNRVRAGLVLSGSLLFAVDEKGLVSAYDKKSFKLLWQLDLKVPVYTTGVYDRKRNRLIVPSKNSIIHCIDSKGKIIWKYRTAGVILSSPALIRSGDIYITSMDHHLYSLSADGKLKWKYKTGGWIISSPVVDSRGNVYFGSYDKSFYCLNSKGGLIWKYSGNGSFNASPVLDQYDNVYTGDSSGMVYGFSSDGRKFFSFAHTDFIRTEMTIDEEENLLVAGSIDSSLFAFRCKGKLSKKAGWCKSHGDSSNSGTRR